MCGFVGTVNWGDAGLVARMTAVLAHRGPDDDGVEAVADGDLFVGLGSRRLAIRDLSPAGHMPMWNAAGDICIAYNGEIYNADELRGELEASGRCFRSRSDTEVVLQLYDRDGPDSIGRLRGMFAFFIWDGRRLQAVVARDALGIKPLYYAEAAGRFACASELKALQLLPGLDLRIDPAALDRFMTFLWVPEPHTIFSTVRKLPAGHYGVYRAGSLRLHQYWDLRFPEAGTAYRRTADDLTQEVGSRFSRAVRSQLVSDVPLGAFLSSGVDSAAIAAEMARGTSGRIRTYTATFTPDALVGESNLDDPRVAEAFAARLGAEQHTLVLEPDVARALPELLWHMDEPVADPAIIPAFSICRAASESSTVLMSGIGGDEVFGGYRKYTAHYWAKAYRRVPAPLRDEIVAPLVGGLSAFRGSRHKTAVRWSKKMVQSGSLPDADRFLMDSTYGTADFKRRIYTGGFHDEVKGLDPWEGHRRLFRNVAHADFLHQMLYVDTKAFLPSLNLNYNDKMSMACSVEVRVPFLDQDLVEFSAREIPPRLKVAGVLRNRRKHVFRRAMKSILPPEILDRPKASFGSPVDRWLACDLHDMVDELPNGRGVGGRGWFRPEVIRDLIAEHRSGRRDWSMQIWQLLTLDLWLKAFSE